MKNKLVIASPNIKSRALKELANELSERLGYRVYRVTPDSVHGRRVVEFRSGLDKRDQFQAFQRDSISSPSCVFRNTDCHSFAGRKVVARTLTNASEGRGIVIFDKETDPIPAAPLYTEYIPKTKEFRVHVFNNAVIDVTEKRKKKSFENERDTQIRNTANGYVFCRSDIVEPADLRDLAIAAVRSLDRTQGAVDIIWNKKQNKSFVLEVNSRPGMEGTTIKKYADAIMESLK